MDLLRLQSFLWVNDSHKLVFTSHAKDDRLYWFRMDVFSGKRDHGLYIENKIKMDYKYYDIKELATFKFAIILQLIDEDDKNCLINFQGLDMPSTKGEPYIINK